MSHKTHMKESCYMHNIHTICRRHVTHHTHERVISHVQARNTYDLIDGGSEIPVTGANVSQFVHLYVQHVLYIFSAKALTVCLYVYLC